MPIVKSPKTTLLRRTVVRALLFALFATCLSFCADFYIRQEWYLLEPNAAPTGGRYSDLEGEEFVLPVRVDEEIHYRKYLTTAMPSKGSVFYLHGNKGNMDLCEWEIEFLIKLGHDVWTMDYRGYGDSDGAISESALKEDARHVFDAITAQDSSESIVIWGRSFGSGVAASVAAAVEKKPKMLVLETPYWSLVDVVRQKRPFIPTALFRYELPTHEFLKSANCPIHLVHGTLDEKIPFNSSERLHDFCRSNSIEIKGHPIMCGVHNLREDRTLADFEEIAAKILR